MSIIEQIKTEIERLKEHTSKCGYPGQDEYADGNKEGRNFICDKLLSFLSTLESEKPVHADLEEAAENHIRKVVDTAGHPGWDWTTQDIAEAFIAGAKWHKEQMMSEAVEGEVDFINKKWGLYDDEEQTDAFLRRMGVKREQKVRIIIVKED